MENKKNPKIDKELEITTVCMKQSDNSDTYVVKNKTWKKYLYDHLEERRIKL